MTQHALEPTRHRKGLASSVLDLVFTLDPNMVNDQEHLPPLGHSLWPKGGKWSVIMKFYGGPRLFVTMILKCQLIATN